MKISIMQPGYLPWLGFFELIEHCDQFVILDDVQYTKRDWRSRNRIRTKDGWMWLSVPVISKGLANQLISDAKINNDTSWSRKHLKNIKTNYMHAKFFNQYIKAFENIYSNKWDKLIDLNMEIIFFVVKELGIKTPIILSSSLSIPNDITNNERIIKICKSLKATNLYDSEGAKAFIDLKLFEEANINVTFQSYKHPEYTQTYKPFLKYMSIIDLLFNEGPNSKNIIF